MSKPKVLHIQQFVYPYRLPVFEELAKVLDLEIYFSRAKRKFRRWSTKLPENTSYKAKILRSIYLWPVVFNPELSKILRKPYDVYSVAGLDRITLLQFLFTLFIAKIRNAPFVMVDEFLVTDYYRSRRRISYALNILIRKILYRYIDAFVLWNKLGKQFVEQIGVPTWKVFCGPQVMTDDEQGFRRKNNEPTGLDLLANDQVINLVYVGNLIEIKGVHILIKAIKALRDDNIQLLIVGSGPWEHKLRNLAGNDKRVVFCGHLEGQEKRNIFKESHIFVLPSLHEPWGFVVNEAIEWGMPVITTNAVGSANYLVKSNGYIVHPGDVAALSGAIASMIRDREKMRIMGKVSIELSEHLTMTDMAKPFLDAVSLVTQLQYKK